MKIFKSLFKEKINTLINIENIISSDFPYSDPINFGEKSVWTCLKTNKISSVLKTFKAEELKKTNWSEAFKRENEDYLFIVGPIKGWIFIIGWSQVLPNYNDGMDKVNSYLNDLSNLFHESQYYCCQRTTDTVIWVKSIKGKIIRSFCNGDGIFSESGTMSYIERKLKIVNKSPEDFTEKEWENFALPGIEKLTKVAADWSINPCEIDKIENVPKFGYLLKPINNILQLKNNTH